MVFVVFMGKVYSKVWSELHSKHILSLTLDSTNICTGIHPPTTLPIVFIATTYWYFFTEAVDSHTFSLPFSCVGVALNPRNLKCAIELTNIVADSQYWLYENFSNNSEWSTSRPCDRLYWQRWRMGDWIHLGLSWLFDRVLFLFCVYVAWWLLPVSGLIIVWSDVHFKPCQSAHANMLQSLISLILPQTTHMHSLQVTVQAWQITYQVMWGVITGVAKSSHHPQSNSITHQVTWWVMIESWPQVTIPTINPSYDHLWSGPPIIQTWNSHI